MQAFQQYDGQSLSDIENVLLDKSIKLAHDGLHVRLSPQCLPGNILFYFQEKKCKAYQLSVQSLCTDLPVHDRFDGTRHQGANSMKYFADKTASEEANSDMDLESDEGLGVTSMEGGEVNPEAYDLEWVKKDAGIVGKEEKAGVLHLAHCWIQQGQKKKARQFFPHPLRAFLN